jgi:hypothetical protein
VWACRDTEKARDASHAASCDVSKQTASNLSGLHESPVATQRVMHKQPSRRVISSGNKSLFLVRMRQLVLTLSSCDAVWVGVCGNALGLY